MNQFLLAEDIEAWATAHPRRAQEILPELIIKLILCSSQITDYNFPIEKGIQFPGYDGILVSKEGTAYFPEGKSVWEFGTNEDDLTKFRSDFEKRSEDPLGEKPDETAFVFASIKIWNHRISIGELIHESKEKHPWKEIRILDGSKIALWLQSCPAVTVTEPVSNMSRETCPAQASRLISSIYLYSFFHLSSLQLVRSDDLDELADGEIAVAQEPLRDDADADPSAAGVSVIICGGDVRQTTRRIGEDDVTGNGVEIRPGIGRVVAAEKPAVLLEFPARVLKDAVKIATGGRAFGGARLAAYFQKTLLENVVLRLVVSVERITTGAGLVDDLLNADLGIRPSPLDQAQQRVADQLGNAHRTFDFWHKSPLLCQLI